MLKSLVNYILYKSGRICDFAYHQILYKKTKDIKHLQKVREKFWCGNCIECHRLNIVRGKQK